MGRRDKRRARARKIERRQARRETSGAPSRGRRTSLPIAEVRAILGGKPEATTELLGAFIAVEDPIAPLLQSLLDHVEATAPKILGDPRLHEPLVLLADSRPRWLRPLASWGARGKSRRTQLDSLIDHLLVRYPVPRFLYAVFHTEEVGIAGVELFVHLAQGGSMRGAIDRGLLPAAMTRAMCHTFVQTAGECSVIDAVRRAQVLAFGGRVELLAELRNTFLGCELVDDAYWSGVIGWLCRDDVIVPGQVGHVLDHIRRARIADPELGSDPRTLRRLATDRTRWHEQLRQLPVDARPYCASGFVPGEWTTPPDSDAASDDETWTVTEILHPSELAYEGARLRHCVYSYDDRVRAGSCSIWSLQRNGRRKLTIEVWNATRRIVQVRGRKNRAPREREAAFVSRWASSNGLAITA